MIVCYLEDKAEVWIENSIKETRMAAKCQIKGVKDGKYKKEYKEYHGKPEQIKRRARRVQARRDMEAEGRVHKGDGKDIDHKDGNPMNNNTSNLKVSSIHHNRSRNNNKELREELGAGEWGTFELLRKYLKDTPFMQIQNHKAKEDKVDVRNCRDNK